MKDDPVKNFIVDLNSEFADTARAMYRAAQTINVNPLFQAELEKRLKDAHKPKGIFSMPTSKKLMAALGWAMALIVLAIVLNWAIRSLAPEPMPAAGNTPTSSLPQENSPAPPNAPNQAAPAPNGNTYDWHGTTLYLSQPLPQSPAEANIYWLKLDQHATVESARALAQRLGIAGEVYQSAGELPGTTDFFITDGKQSLSVRSDRYFTYYADLQESPFAASNPPDASATIDQFLKAHGFDFEYKLEYSDIMHGYHVEPLTPDGLVIPEDYLLFTLDETGQVASITANLLDYEPIGMYGIRSAEQAWQQLLDPNGSAGLVEWAASPGRVQHVWRRIYPLDQTVTLYGRVTSRPSIEPGKPPFVQIDLHSATGNTNGMDGFSQNSYFEATGQFIMENGIEEFNVTTWKVSDLLTEDGLVGTLRKEGEQVILETADGNYTLTDMPVDLPMPFENAFVIGTKLGNTFDWKIMDDRMTPNGSAGGGGGGGLGLYRLNLSGTPVPFPTPTPIPGTPTPLSTSQTYYLVQAGDTLSSIAQAYGISSEELMRANGIDDPAALFVGQTLIIPGVNPQQIEGLRGIVTITINKQAKGSQRMVYGFMVDPAKNPGGYMLLEGEDLQPLQQNNNRPVDIWGVVDHLNENGMPVITVERYEIPFPDLSFQILRGTQKLTEVEGQPATLFTTGDGKTYVQLYTDGTTGSSLIGVEGDEVLLEALIIPDEAFGGYAALRVFGGSLAINPKNGQPVELTVTADQPPAVDEPSPSANPTPPTAAIEKVELVYYVPDPRYVPASDQRYIQPVWRFYGHYSNGDEFEVLIQALKEEFLLPELAPFAPPG